MKFFSFFALAVLSLSGCQDGDSAATKKSSASEQSFESLKRLNTSLRHLFAIQNIRKFYGSEVIDEVLILNLPSLKDVGYGIPIKGGYIVTNGNLKVIGKIADGKLPTSALNTKEIDVLKQIAADQIVASNLLSQHYSRFKGFKGEVSENFSAAVLTAEKALLKAVEKFKILYRKSTYDKTSLNEMQRALSDYGIASRSADELNNLLLAELDSAAAIKEAKADIASFVLIAATWGAGALVTSAISGSAAASGGVLSLSLGSFTGAGGGVAAMQLASASVSTAVVAEVGTAAVNFAGVLAMSGYGVNSWNAARQVQAVSKGGFPNFGNKPPFQQQATKKASEEAVEGAVEEVVKIQSEAKAGVPRSKGLQFSNQDFMKMLVNFKP